MSELTFTRPEILQTGSRLLQLPAELRLTIYGLLLKHDEPIEHDEATDHILHVGGSTPSYNSRTQLSSQLLRTCQQLQREAGDYLYAKNFLVIGFDFHGDWGYDYFCHVLSHHVQIPYGPTKIANGVVDLRTCSQEHSFKHPTMVNMHQALSQTWPSLTRFERVKLNLLYKHTWNVFTACYLIRTLVCQKIVQVSMSEVETWTTTPGAPLPRPGLPRLKCLQWPRCKVFRIEGIRASAVPDIVNKIMGPDPVHDILPLYNKLHILLNTRFGEFYRGGLQPGGHRNTEEGNMIKALSESLAHNGAQKFLQNKTLILRQAIKRKEAQVEAERTARDMQGTRSLGGPSLPSSEVILKAANSTSDLGRKSDGVIQMALEVMEEKL
ncbi:hypothetical protein PMZ80_006437 [Knufia obscura]|uniref:Uncharacterized protein n=2 Tax=Knufia TaxID=430999 RepID=A0AAN8EE03_9EURO|nr:hypothetical protein PMZ80_006437 [Knufia obscura]KAK5953414.1 hypothetical protein OHC33_005358 [Knufia fluminis]